MVSLSHLFDRLTAAWHQRAVAIKALSFAVVGVVNSSVDLGVFAIAYFYLELPLVVANVMAWTVAVTGSYVLNTLTTFARESGRALGLKVYVSFVLSQVAGLVVNTAVTFVASYVMPVLAGKVLAAGASFLVNLSLSYFVVFRERIRLGPRRELGHRRENGSRLAWLCSAAIAIFILGVVAANMLWPHGGTPSATDISSRSRLTLPPSTRTPLPPQNLR